MGTTICTARMMTAREERESQRVAEHNLDCYQRAGEARMRADAYASAGMTGSATVATETARSALAEVIRTQ